MSNQAAMERVKRKLGAAVTRVGEILHETKNPQNASEVEHQYDDKFYLAEYLTHTSVASERFIMSELGITADMWAQLKDWSKNQSVTLRFACQSTCEFVETKVKKVEGNTEHVTEVKHGLLPTTKITEKVVHKVTTHYWKFSVNWQLIVFPGTTDPNSGNVLKSESSSCTLTTSVKSTPQPERRVHVPIDVVLNWFLETTDEKGRSTFTIDRLVESCRTPRRNTEIDQALRACSMLKSWCTQTKSFFSNVLFPVQPHREKISMDWRDKFKVFVPVMPIFRSTPREDENKDGEEKQSLLVLSTDQVNLLLKQQETEFQSKVDAAIQTLPTEDGLIRVSEAKVVMALMQLDALCDAYTGSIEYIEDMLRTQLVAAIGKLITPADFQAYMEYHARKLLLPAYQPRPYSYAVRRPKHYPEGTVGIETHASDGSMAQPVNTQVFVNTNSKSDMHFSISASTKISFHGEQYLHCWMTHQFRDSNAIKYDLTARARQYSCFVLMVGRISAANEFDPKHAIVLQNKDELIIPLLFEHLPSAGEFRDAIESLSPEQQRFAKAYRSMQLESTLFGLCIVQIKPQLEKLLNLPPQSLTKERRLTQELMTLFTKYQISSDLVRYDGEEDVKVKYKIAAVKEQVKTILTEIDEELNKDLEEKKRETQYQVQQQLKQKNFDPFSSTPIPTASYSAVGGQMDFFASAMPMPAPPSESAARSISSLQQSIPPPSPQVELKTVEITDNTAASDNNSGGVVVDENASASGLNYTSLPGKMDSRFLSVDKDNALRSSILNLGKTWKKKFQTSVLAKPQSKQLQKDEQKDEKNKAFDLLDALSRSGELAIGHTDLHVILPVTHSFHDTLINTVIQGNVNPIEKVERSILLVTSLINNDQPMLELAQPSHKDRLRDLAPSFYITDESKNNDL